MIEKNPERIFGVLIRVEDTFEIADEEHVTGERGAGVRTDVRVPQLGGEGTEPVRHAVYHSRAWPGEALRPEAGECLVKRVKQTTDLMAVALRTGYVGEQSAERRVNCTKSVSVVILGLGEQGTFVALTLPVLPPDLTAEILVDRGVEAVECGGYDGNFSLFRDALEAVKMSVHVFHEALEAHEEIPVYLAGQFLQLRLHLGGEVFQRVLHGLHVVLACLLGEFGDSIVHLIVDEEFKGSHCVPLYSVGVFEELVARLHGLLEVTKLQGVDVILYAFQFLIDAYFFQFL
ncbi:glucosamine-fructose-6-phosphate isomerizing protein, putative [Babesia ovata]|uniref:Glucosamine-fructose-6-phosphate isomerizing protein, putative n=1 Tax=Babesia ovata TaxID=189622 RepID=A0A2H6KJU5_9APIC|nr:glucosamine-fructose-6-phosphate isomerizing protein, putative [Babesia ovata]GBE63262.1 glucosamine-fructose-6-phosphate isomerizing protein, putative [Babesia ovata]